MRILFELESINDHTVSNTNDYHKFQGFVYDELIRKTDFEGIHESKTYKFFCFSNIFPPSMAKSGELRYFLFSSPNKSLIKSVFSKSNLMLDSTINIGDQQYRLKSLKLLEMQIIGKRCIVRTSTPISVRIPERMYTQYNIPNEQRKNNFLYWRTNLSFEIFRDSIENNMRSKYKFFYNKDFAIKDPIIQAYALIKEVVIHISVDNYTVKVPASFWRFYFENLNNERMNFLNFIFDSGMGERNSMGLGFLNVEEGAKISYLERI